MIFTNHYLNFFAQITQSQLKKQIQFLKVENQVLRCHCNFKRLFLSEREKNRLLKFGLPLGGDIKNLISVVHYSTFRRWIQQKTSPCPSQLKQKRGRPPKLTLAIKHLIVHMAKHNKWGYTKILGELKKLNIIKTSRTSVKNVLLEWGIDPMKIRSQDTWDQFLKRTFNTLWACDFFTKTVYTPLGKRVYYVLFYIHIKTRKVYIAGITGRPDKTWVIEKTKALKPFLEQGKKAALIRDRDTKFTKELDEFFTEKNIKVLKIPYRSPNLNPYAESCRAFLQII